MNFSVFFACFVVYVSSMEHQHYLSNDVESQRDSEESGQEVYEIVSDEDGLDENEDGSYFSNRTWNRTGGETPVFGGNINNNFPFQAGDKADEDYYKSIDREMQEQEEIHIKNKLPETDEENKFQEEEEDCDCCCTIM
uniref:Secreted protein n=1 Tax=Meloidogyne incognita TaxID=6306 RepID=A0A914MJS8_MELIC